MEPVKLLALDLDGTLLNSKKELTPRTRAALYAAAEAGIEIVPTTGRFFGAMPEEIRTLPFLHYAITINGAQVYDIRRDCAVSRAELPLEKTLRIMEYLDSFPVIYDCYMDNWGWITRSMQARAADYITNPHSLYMARELRHPVDDLKTFLRERGQDVQKTQLFTADDSLRLQLLHSIGEKFEGLSISSSVSCNVEINDAHANKGEAIAALAAYLGLPMAQTMAIGDGLNDRSMIRMTGVGVAMQNACPELLALADEVTASCDEDGAAIAIERHCVPGKANHG